jgi:5'-nucleotidase
MKQVIISNNDTFNNIIDNIKFDWYDNLHILADFDGTLTKANSAWKKRPSIISVLRSEWYLWEEYSKKAHELFDYYHAIEIDPNISIEKKKEEMENWRTKHIKLLIESNLNKTDIEKVVESWSIQFRDWVLDMFDFLKKNNIPLIIMSASWLWTDSIRMYFEKQNVLTDNVHIISNEFIWNQNWKAVWHVDKIIHSFNKWETVLEDFPEIYDKIKDRKNVVLLWDSLWDPSMVEWFDFKNLLKVWFLNEKLDELLDTYKQNYDLVLSWDSDIHYLNDLIFKQ